MEPGQRRGPETPRGVALAGREWPRLPAGPAGHGPPRQREVAPGHGDTPRPAGHLRPQLPARRADEPRGHGEEPPRCVAEPRGHGEELPCCVAEPRGHGEELPCCVAEPRGHGEELPCCVAEPRGHGEEPLCYVSEPWGRGGEEPPSTAGFPGELPPGQPETGQCVVALPPCHGRPGPVVGVLPPEPAVSLPSPPALAREQTREILPRGRCLIHNWQEERATNELDQVPNPDLGSEGVFYRHGHHGLLTPQGCAHLADSTTMKDAYRRPVPTGLPRRGQREAMLELMLYHKYREETLREHSPHPAPMESLSTMRQDYWREGFCSAPPPPTQPHDYRMEQPRSFWLENAARIPGITKPRAGDTPFKRNAAFSTPVEDRLEPPAGPALAQQ